MNLIEVTICDQVFVIAYEADTTIARLAEMALAEYQAAFYERVPSKVKYVQDTKKRILSGTLLVNDASVEKSLTVELIDSNNAAGARKSPKDDICSQYRMWQQYTSSRALQCLETMADSTHREDPSDAFLDMLQDLRRSRFEEVQMHTVEALGLLLDYFRHKKFAMFAMQEMLMVVHESEYPKVAIAALRKISSSRTSHKYIYPAERLVADMARLLKVFDDNIQAEFFDLHDYLESAITSGHADAIASPELMAAERSSRSPRRACSDITEVESEDICSSLSREADAKHSGGREMGSGQEKCSTDIATSKAEHGPSDFSSTNIERVLVLLVSEEQKSRQYAIKKAIVIIWDFAQHSHAVTHSLEPKLGKLVASLLACLKASLKPVAASKSTHYSDAKEASHEKIKATHVASLALKSPNTDVLTAQLCVRGLALLSVCQPVVVRSVLLDNQHRGGGHCKLLTTLSHSKDSFSTINSNGDEKVEQLVALMGMDIPALHNAAVLSGIASIAMVGTIHIAEACSMLLILAMKEEGVLRRNLSHQIHLRTRMDGVTSNVDEFINFNECDTLENLGFDMSVNAAWASSSGGGIRLEPRAIGQLLLSEADVFATQSQRAFAPLRVEFALACLLHMSLISSHKTSDKSNETQQWSHRVLDQDVSSQVDIIDILSSYDFALCKMLWRWLSSGHRRPAVLAACILGNVTTSSTIRTFLLQHRSTVFKLLELLEVVVTLSLDPRSDEYIVPFADDSIRNAQYLSRSHSQFTNDGEGEQKSSTRHGAAEAEAGNQLRLEVYTHKCLLWVANANSIVVRYLLKLISNLCTAVGGGSSEHIDAAKQTLRKLIKSEDTSAVVGAMLEGDDVLAFYFRLIMQQKSTSAMSSPRSNDDNESIVT